jgi:alkylation response protein AidB-like acyl-CoA dehydrogenase
MSTSDHSAFGAISLLPLRPDSPSLRAEIVLQASPTSVDSAFAVARKLAATGALPGVGSTRELWEALATAASIDLGAARAIEPQLDAVAILEQARQADLPTADAGDNTWGVFASEGGDHPVIAVRGSGRWTLKGTKQWCSLAASLDSALVSATRDDGRRMLFAVDLHASGVRVDAGNWHARGLTEIPSGPVRFDAVAARPVGDAGWYLDRPGFSWGGIGVAACWYGGAVALGRSLYEAADRDRPLVLMHLGAVDELLQGARRALQEAAVMVDAGTAVGADGRLLAKRVRATVARAAEEVLQRVGHALGPAPLALDGVHAKRVADLQLYLRQHHAERDQQSLGSSVLDTGLAPW